ncbi:hypothetical protein [Faecalibacter macacae]|uniref:Uncharacterized protein n=1 Tax=Faecalibacter macacae TaxID=1859289 RepID=A0A3L9LZZ6_9FLAO|nr:hypothetical protein [Faecalibacter macacae]RLZ06477.1 hypothetical protein EAH69_13415 [Faecalibacter macacae]
MKNYIYIIISLLTANTYAQVGFGTNNPDPEYSLTVEGNVKVEDINLEKALPGMVYSSNGPTTEPSWKVVASDPVSIPNLNYLLFSKSLNNFSALTLQSKKLSGNQSYKIDELNTSWKIIGDNSQDLTFKVTNPSSKVFVTFESLAQVSGLGTGTGTNFACGIFMAESTNATKFGDYKLKGVRIITAERGHATNAFFNFSVSTEIKSEGNFVFDPDKTYKLQVACKRRDNFGNYNGTLVIGGGVAPSTSWAFNSRSFLKINVFEPLN